jgi:hypothetical protein
MSSAGNNPVIRKALIEVCREASLKPNSKKLIQLVERLQRLCEDEQHKTAAVGKSP